MWSGCAYLACIRICFVLFVKQHTTPVTNTYKGGCGVGLWNKRWLVCGDGTFTHLQCAHAIQIVVSICVCVSTRNICWVVTKWKCVCALWAHQICVRYTRVCAWKSYKLQLICGCIFMLPWFLEFFEINACLCAILKQYVRCMLCV